MKIEKKELELYFHIPFCVKKCNYCDFLSAPCTREQKEAYMGALFAELEGRAAEYQDYTVVSVFIGGGTPSIIPEAGIAKLLRIVKEEYDLQENAEITIEVNPGTVNREKLQNYYQAGVNRLSIGLQSAENRELQTLGRIHTYEQFLDTYSLARELGFTNINVDVMSALPGQDLDSYRNTLYRVLNLQPMPEHISAYSLIVEEGTVFAKWEAEGKLDLPDEDSERHMYEETGRILETAGYHRYEISNYSLEGMECRHNCGYWTRKSYVGFGIGAASLVENIRFRNTDELKWYIENPLGCREELQVLSVEEQMEETMFLGLRMTAGVSCEAFQAYFGKSLKQVYGEVIDKNLETGLLRYKENEKGSYLQLTEKGLDVSNYVMSQFLFD